ncbi:MAG TPA: flagellar biosynthetic protein FliR [Caulobacteraceae bacterium]|nr:flagellar biosynthetic protein FliR [Caulobacteraceae bacterium]
MGHYATAAQVWAAALVFSRVGALVMVMPGVAQGGVPPTVRLAFALLLALCIGPIAQPYLPAEPQTVDGTAFYVGREVLIGLTIGGLLQLFLSSMTAAGEFVSLQTTLAFAQTANPTEAVPGTTLSTFLTLLGVTLIFDTDLHRMFIAAMAHSYTLFPPMRPLPLGDVAQLAVETVARSFSLGFQLALPVVVFSLIFNVATGLVGRMMPQFQIFFVATPLSLLLGLSIFALSLGGIGVVWAGAYEAFMRNFV